MGDDDGLALDRVRAIPAQAPTGEHGSSLQAEKKRLETLKITSLIPSTHTHSNDAGMALAPLPRVVLKYDG